MFTWTRPMTPLIASGRRRGWGGAVDDLQMRPGQPGAEASVMLDHWERRDRRRPAAGGVADLPADGREVRADRRRLQQVVTAVFDQLGQLVVPPPAAGLPGQVLVVPHCLVQHG